jgi:CubicO group peptidase (beta-lactamase class C family)
MTALALRWPHLAAMLAVCIAALPAFAQPVGEDRVRALVPALEAYLQQGMKDFDVPGAAVGIVAGDRLVYAKGFGVRGKSNPAPVDPRTVFQIGSTTKAFLSATQAIMVDRGKLRWDDRVADLYPEFQLMDPWVTREFRVFDLLAQRSGLPPYANDALGTLGYDETSLIRSLRHVTPVASFRSAFAYTNITHMLAGRIVAAAAGAPDWNAVLRADLFEPLGMRDSSFEAAAIAATSNHAEGHRWTPAGAVQVPFFQMFPYDWGGAGNINSTVEDMARWVRLHLGAGSFEGRKLISPENLAATHTAKVAINDRATYALGWLVIQTPNGQVVWHNGSTAAFGAFVGLVPQRGFGVIVLTNTINVGMPDALGLWTIDRLLDNPPADRVGEALRAAREKFATGEAQFARPAAPRPAPPLAPLAGAFANPSFGKGAAAVAGGALVLELRSTGAKLALEPWDGDVFTVRLIPEGRFAAVAENAGPRPQAFAQFLADQDGRPNLLRLTFDDGQTYEFRRE